MRSTTPHGIASTLHATLFYHACAFAASVFSWIPDHLRRCCSRPVSYYALFKWWLLLSQHPGCLSRITSYRTELNLGALADGQGCFPFDREDYPSRTHSRDSLSSIRSLVGACRRVAPRPLSVALPLESSGSRLPLKAFRREPDISPFD